ncbi:unnamed protein product, partial [Candidula unifasciata]
MHTSVPNNDLTRRRTSQSSENDSKALNYTLPRRYSSKHYENGVVDHSNGSAKIQSSRQYTDNKAGRTHNLSQRDSPREYNDDISDHSSSTYQRRSSRHDKDIITDHSTESSRRRSSRHYEGSFTDYSKDTHQRRSSRHYENSVRDHSTEKSQRRHSRQYEDGYTDHSNDSSRSRSSKHHEDDIKDRSHPSRRRSLNNYDENVSCRMNDSSKKSSARRYEQYVTDPANKYTSLRSNHTLDRPGYATLPSSTKLGKTERRDVRVHGTSVTERLDNDVGVLLHGKADTSKSRADHGLSLRNYDNYDSLQRSTDNDQLHTSSLQRHSRSKDRGMPKSEHHYHSNHSVERNGRKENHPHQHDLRRNSSQYSTPESVKVDSDQQYASYPLNKHTKINNNLNHRSDTLDARHVKKENIHEDDGRAFFRSSNNDLSDEYKKEKPHRHRQASVDRSSSQHPIEGNEIGDNYGVNRHEQSATKRSSSATRNEGHNRETQNKGSNPSHNKNHASFRSSKEKLEREEGSLFTLSDRRNSGDVSKQKQKSLTEHSLAATNSHKNTYPTAKHNEITSDVGGHSHAHTQSIDGTGLNMFGERQRHIVRPLESGKSVADSHVSRSLTNGIGCENNQKETESAGRSRTTNSNSRRSTSTINKHEESNASSYKQDVTYSRRSSSSRSNGNTGFASSSSSPRREDSQYKLQMDVSPSTKSQDTNHRSREDRQQTRPHRSSSSHNGLTLAQPKEVASSLKVASTNDELYVDRSPAADSTEHHKQDLRSGRKETSISNKQRAKLEREGNPELDTVYPNAEIKNNIVISPGNSSSSILNKSGSPKSVSKVDLIDGSSSTSTLKDSCVTTKTSISDSISSLLGRGNKYQQFRSNQSDVSSTPTSISDRWRKLTRVILPDKDAFSDNSNERKAPAIFYAAATRFMNTLSSVHTVIPKSAPVSAGGPPNDITASHESQNETVLAETHVEEITMSEAKSERNCSPMNTLSIQEHTDKVSPSHSVVSLDVPAVAASQRTSVISTPGTLCNHKMRLSAYALMTEKADASEAEIGNHV